ncbi:glycosyltransferase involved in cell wall biosynthesis [Sinobacterium caligoides]|uniref:Glycosyltransferase involved in cell wall biosynthesis n=1 Tax=Sinobacterium caligoides TaxID=933926 RepID=A0A3N2DYZ1_9GAMM|nr:glycosyltransferase family 4 protein [Sinobacterium caligoides]ROS05048.1 glycosyltransferase involved in cell wall biosynthesis [Sinobacterium caligoides]
MKRKSINITVGTDLKANGGIATVLNVLKDGDFFDRWNVVLLSTHIDNRRFFGLLRVFAFARSLLMIIYYHLFFDVGLVHVHASLKWSFLRKAIVIRLVKFLGGRVILHLHSGGFSEFYENECSERQQEKIRDIFNLSDRVIVLSSQWLSWVRGIVLQQDKVEVVYNAVPDLHLSRKDADRNVILFLGKLSESKGVGDLIEAFSLVLERFPEARLILGGNGDVDYYRKQVKAKGLERNVVFLGWVTGEEKLAWLQRAGVYTLPSYHEGFPMGVLEAMSAGIPVVASTAGGIPDAITDGEEGLLIEAGDRLALAECLSSLIADSTLSNAYAKAAKNKFTHNFSPASVFPCLDGIYESILS